MIKFRDTFKDICILSSDTEILKDYFSFGFKVMGKHIFPQTDENLKFYKGKKYIYECRTDEDCYKFYEFYRNNFEKNTIQIYYNALFDKAMIDMLMLKVLNKSKNILKSMRFISHLICCDGINYWHLKKLILENKLNFNDLENEKDAKQLFYMEMSTLKGVDTTQILNKFNIIDAAVAGNNVFADNNKLRPCTSLKKFQFGFMGEQLKFDFSKYETIADIIKDNNLETFIKYSLYDLDSLEQFVINFCIPVFENRFKIMENHNINILKNYRMLFSESNTHLIHYLNKMTVNKSIKCD